MEACKHRRRMKIITEDRVSFTVKTWKGNLLLLNPRRESRRENDLMIREGNIYTHYEVRDDEDETEEDSLSSLSVSPVSNFEERLQKPRETEGILISHRTLCMLNNEERSHRMTRLTRDQGMMQCRDFYDNNQNSSTDLMTLILLKSRVRKVLVCRIELSFHSSTSYKSSLLVIVILIFLRILHLLTA